MQNTLSASIVVFNPQQLIGGATHRVVLYNGRPAESARREVGGSHELFFATTTHQNIFFALKGLRKDLMKWVTERVPHGEPCYQVKGLNSKVEETICWPITATDEPNYYRKGPADEWNIEKKSRAFAHQGLALAPVWRHERWQAFLYTLLPRVPIEEIPDRAYLDTYKHVNLFEAAARLEAIVEQRENERGVRLAGIHDSSPCWPKGLGAELQEESTETEVVAQHSGQAVVEPNKMKGK